jgi:hypothetical protein
MLFCIGVLIEKAVGIRKDSFHKKHHFKEDASVFSVSSKAFCTL